MNTNIPAGWKFRRNKDGSVGIFAPTPQPGESRRTSAAVYASQDRDLHELLGKLADHMAAPPPAPADAYQGHLPDGSSVQKHSAGGAYPYVLVLRDSQRPGEKFDWGLIGPGLPRTIWLRSRAVWDGVVSELKLGADIGTALFTVSSRPLAG